VGAQAPPSHSGGVELVVRPPSVHARSGVGLIPRGMSERGIAHCHSSIHSLRVGVTHTVSALSAP
jgi:hypothetical protein